MKRFPRLDFLILLLFAIPPTIDRYLPTEFRLSGEIRTIFIFAIMGLGLNIVTGFTGLLNLGVAAFMAIGAYSFAILGAENFPYRLGFWPALIITPFVGAFAGLALGSPTLRLRGDYIAIVTLGFGEIVQDVLRNVDTITKGTQGINPLPSPFHDDLILEHPIGWYYILLAILTVVVIMNRNLENSRIGRAWIAIREDELAATCMGINPVRNKLLAFAFGAALCSLAGALFAAQFNSTGEPGNYDFSRSITVLCVVIVGGMGNISGVLVGAVVMIGLDTIFLTKLTDFLAKRGLASTDNVYSSPGNWKFMIFGLALILMMRFRPEGLLPSRRRKAELHESEKDATPAGSAGSGA